MLCLAALSTLPVLSVTPFPSPRNRNKGLLSDKERIGLDVLSVSLVAVTDFKHRQSLPNPELLSEQYLKHMVVWGEELYES